MHPQDRIERCRGCGAWKFHARPCPDCETHYPTYWIDQQLDETYRVCALCGKDWPCVPDTRREET